MEVQEYNCHVGSDDGTAAEATHLLDWVEQMNEASKKFGKEFRICATLKKNMEEAGFVDVHEEVYKVPIGPWAKGKKNKELGIYYRAQFIDAVEPFTMALFTRVLGYTAEQTKEVVAQVKPHLINPKLHMYVPFYLCLGQETRIRPRHGTRHDSLRW